MLNIDGWAEVRDPFQRATAQPLLVQVGCAVVATVDKGDLHPVAPSVSQVSRTSFTPRSLHIGVGDIVHILPGMVHRIEAKNDITLTRRFYPV